MKGKFQKKRGCVISLDNSWCITVDHRLHNRCCATEDTNYLNYISYLFQQHILSLSTTSATRRG